MEKEIWKDIEGYEGKYQVSNLGRVKSLNYRNTGKEQFLKLHENINGYISVNLWKNGNGSYPCVHGLVLEAFDSNPYNLTDVNHKDKNRKNNRLENLEWISHQDNIDYSLSKKVLCVETGEVYISSHEASRQTGANQSNIIQCCQGKRNVAGGYHWRYAD